MESLSLSFNPWRVVSVGGYVRSKPRDARQAWYNCQVDGGLQRRTGAGWGGGSSSRGAAWRKPRAGYRGGVCRAGYRRRVGPGGGSPAAAASPQPGPHTHRSALSQVNHQPAFYPRHTPTKDGPHVEREEDREGRNELCVQGAVVLKYSLTKIDTKERANIGFYVWGGEKFTAKAQSINSQY